VPQEFSTGRPSRTVLLFPNGRQVILPLSSSHRLVERETVRLTTTTTGIYCHNGPLSPMVIGCTSARRFFVTPLMVTEPPAEVMPLLRVTL